MSCDSEHAPPSERTSERAKALHASSFPAAVVSHSTTLNLGVLHPAVFRLSVFTGLPPRYVTITIQYHSTKQNKNAYHVKDDTPCPGFTSDHLLCHTTYDLFLGSEYPVQNDLTDRTNTQAPRACSSCYVTGIHTHDYRWAVSPPPIFLAKKEPRLTDYGLLCLGPWRSCPGLLISTHGCPTQKVSAIDTVDFVHGQKATPSRSTAHKQSPRCTVAKTRKGNYTTRNGSTQCYSSRGPKWSLRNTINTAHQFAQDNRSNDVDSVYVRPCLSTFPRHRFFSTMKPLLLFNKERMMAFKFLVTLLLSPPCFIEQNGSINNEEKPFFRTQTGRNTCVLCLFGLGKPGSGRRWLRAPPRPLTPTPHPLLHILRRSHPAGYSNDEGPPHYA
ncbi:unnamed protein product [Ectocarpus sp. 12 AP-2014]